MRVLLIVFLLFGCASSKLFSVEENGDIKLVGECWTWGQAECTLINPETKEELVIIETKGLSDNGVNTIVDSVTGLPEAIIKALMPFPL